MDSFIAIFQMMAIFGSAIESVTSSQGAALAAWAKSSVFPAVAAMLLFIPIANHLLSSGGLVDMISDFVKGVLSAGAIWVLLNNWSGGDMSVAGAARALDTELKAIAISSGGGSGGDVTAFVADKIAPASNQLFKMILDSYSLTNLNKGSESPTAPENIQVPGV